MDANTTLETDFKKWLTFNNHLGEYQKLYDLYTSLNRKNNYGSVTIESSIEEGSTRYSVKQEGVGQVLQLEDDAHRNQLLDYMLKYYFPDGNVEEWYKSKTQEQDRSGNHQIFNKGNEYHKSTFEDIKPHKKELTYYTIKLVVSIIFYTGVLIFLLVAFLDSTTSGLLAVFGLLGLTLLFYLARLFGHGLLIGIIQGNAIRVTESQYPDIFEIAKVQAKEMGLKEIPQIYIAAGHFNAFVTKLARTKYLMLFSEVIETTQRGDYDVLKFVVGHELGHVKRNHLGKGVWLFPSNFIPFLSMAYSRGCEYTCDRIGNYFSRKGALEGVLILTTGKEVYTKVNIEEFLTSDNEYEGFWFWLSEKFLSHPHTIKRARALYAHNKDYYS